MSRCHRNKISRSQRSRGPVNMAEKKNEKNGLYNFRVYECTREQNGSPFVPSFDNANGRLCQERLSRSRNFATVVT